MTQDLKHKRQAVYRRCVFLVLGLCVPAGAYGLGAGAQASTGVLEGLMSWQWCLGLSAAGLVVLAGCVVLSLYLRGCLSNGAALRESEERFRNLSELLPEIVYEVNLDGLLTFVNLQAYEMTGYSIEDFERGVNVFDLLVPADRERARDNVAKLARGETPGSRVYTMQRKDGTTFKVISRTTVVVRNGKPVGLRGILVNITEREKAEAALRESEERYRMLVESARDIIVGVSTEGNFTFLNPAFETVTGWTRSAWLGRSCMEIIHPDTVDTITDIFGRALRGEDPDVPELKILTKSGDVVTVELSGAPDVRDGQLMGFLGIGRDITTQTKLEEQLRQAQKMEAIGQLAGGVAHDFNNLLAGIMGYAELLKYALHGNPEAVRSTDAILDTSRRAAELTRQLLEFSRSGSMQTVPVGMHEIIREVTGLLEHTIDRRIRIRHRFDAPSDVIMGDPAQLQNTILNLGVNARDAMPDGGEIRFISDLVELDESFSPTRADVVQPGTYLEITVADTGTGIPPEILERIFEPFFTTKEVGKGTGLGLAAVYGIIKRHGGTIRIDSTPGEGTRFKLYLPLADVLEQQPDTPGTDRLIRGTGRILLVDDEAVIRNMAWTMLTQLGYEVVLAEDGTDAVDVYTDTWRDIDLVILDVVMPRMSGTKALGILKQINPDIRVLVSSGYTGGGEFRELADAGVMGTLQKPFVMSELSRRVAEVLGNGEEERKVSAG